jgi:hypothetical protein
LVAKNVNGGRGEATGPDDEDKSPFKGDTVIVVHGTFAAPKDVALDQPRGDANIQEWYRPNGSFCRLLDDCLAKLGVPMRTWKHLDEGHEQFFFWSGDNSWQARAHAAEQLANYIRRLAARGWRSHIVAHSHGGNVVVEALMRLGWLNGSRELRLGNICFLGTPIYGRPKPKRSSRRYIQLYCFVGLIITVALHDFLYLPSYAARLIQSPAFVWLCGISVITLFLRGAWSYISDISSSASSWFWSLGMGLQPRWAGPATSFLAINSISDEAFQLLAAIQNAKGPLNRVRLKPLTIAATSVTFTRHYIRHIFGDESLVSWVTGLITSVIIGTTVVSILFGDVVPSAWPVGLLMSYTILGSISLLSTFRGLAWPLRVLFGCYIWLAAAVRAVVTTLVSNRLWETIQDAVLGMSGAPYSTRDISVSRGEQEQKLENSPLFYEELSPDIAERYIARRDPEVSDIVRRILRSVDGPQVLVEAIDGLKQTTTNVTLLHAAYYRELVVIKRIAQWLVKGPTDQQLADRGLRVIHPSDPWPTWP